jgi:hypothetical protein
VRRVLVDDAAHGATIDVRGDGAGATFEVTLAKASPPGTNATEKSTVASDALPEK